MTSQVWSHVECLMPTDNILVLLLHSNFSFKTSLNDGFSIPLNAEVTYFLLVHPVGVLIVRF